MASSSMFADSIDPIVQLIESFSPKRPSISGPSPFSDLDDHDTLQFLYEFDMHAHSGSVENTVYPSDSTATLQEDLDSLTESSVLLLPSYAKPTLHCTTALRSSPSVIQTTLPSLRSATTSLRVTFNTSLRCLMISPPSASRISHFIPTVRPPRL